MYSNIVFPDTAPSSSGNHTIGVLKGEGIGPEVIDVALACLGALSERTGLEFSLEFGGDIGKTSEISHGKSLTEEVSEFCNDVFLRGGAIIAGAGGSRFVYDLRKQHELYCKLSPLQPFTQLRNASCLKPDQLEDVDIMIVRENMSGVYQGSWSQKGSRGNVRALHSFQYTEKEVRDILHVASAVAAQRSGRLSVIYKESGVPSISDLWKSCAQEICGGSNVDLQMVDVDFAAYLLIKEARDMDVVAAPNLFGDILSDLGALLLGSRGMSYSGNFSRTGAAVYQTNHGAAYDLAGTDRSNPIGQILSLCMLLQESFALNTEAALIESAVKQVLDQGYRTADISEKGCRVIGTREMGDRISQQIVNEQNCYVEDTTTGSIADRSSA